MSCLICNTILWQTKVRQIVADYLLGKKRNDDKIKNKKNKKSRYTIMQVPISWSYFCLIYFIKYGNFNKRNIL